MIRGQYPQLTEITWYLFSKGCATIELSLTRSGTRTSAILIPCVMILVQVRGHAFLKSDDVVSVRARVSSVDSRSLAVICISKQEYSD